MSRPPDEEAFREYWEKAQPLFAVQQKTGKPLTDIDQIREIQRQIEQAYKAAWSEALGRVEEYIEGRMR